MTHKPPLHTLNITALVTERTPLLNTKALASRQLMPSGTIASSVNGLSTALWTNKKSSSLVNSKNFKSKVSEQKLSLNTQNLDLLSSIDLAFIVNLTSNSKSRTQVNYCPVYPSKFNIKISQKNSKAYFKV